MVTQSLTRLSPYLAAFVAGVVVTFLSVGLLMDGDVEAEPDKTDGLPDLGSLEVFQTAQKADGIPMKEPDAERSMPNCPIPEACDELEAEVDLLRKEINEREVSLLEAIEYGERQAAELKQLGRSCYGVAVSPSASCGVAQFGEIYRIDEYELHINAERPFAILNLNGIPLIHFDYVAAGGLRVSSGAKFVVIDGDIDNLPLSKLLSMTYEDPGYAALRTIVVRVSVIADASYAVRVLDTRPNSATG